MSDIDDLRKLHDEIKLHPFRENNDDKYWPDYRSKLLALSHMFWEVYGAKYPYKEFKNRCMDGFIHDFNGSICNRNIPHIERCLGYIHRYLDTGECLEYATYYGGCNILPGINRLRIFKWSPEKNKFIPQYTADELKIYITKCDPEYRDYYVALYKELIGEDYIEQE